MNGCVLGQYQIVDRPFERAALRQGEADQTIVRIVKVAPRDTLLFRGPRDG